MPPPNEFVSSVDQVFPPSSENSSLCKFDRVRKIPIHFQDYDYYFGTNSFHKSYSFYEAYFNPIWQ